MVNFTDNDYLELKNLVEQTLDNVESMSSFDDSISNLEQMIEILERVTYGNRNRSTA
jgi:hypothetical protein